jgi:hypothetical protein
MNLRIRFQAWPDGPSFIMVSACAQTYSAPEFYIGIVVEGHTCYIGRGAVLEECVADAHQSPQESATAIGRTDERQPRLCR